MMLTFFEREILLTTSLINNIDESFNRCGQFSKVASDDSSFWEFNVLTGTIYWNKTVSEITGYFPKDIQGNMNVWWRNNICLTNRKSIIKEVENLLASENDSWYGKYSFCCKNGTYKNLFEKLYVVRDSDKKVVRLIGFVSDLTSLKEFEASQLALKNEMIRNTIADFEKERKEISEELHENISQLLVAVNLHIDMSKQHTNSAGTEWLNKAQHMLTDSINGIRKLSRILSPHSLQSFGLKRAFMDLTEDFMSDSSKMCTLTAPDSVGKRLNEEQKIVLYRSMLMYFQAAKQMKYFCDINVVLKCTETGVKLGFTILDPSPGHQKVMATVFPRLQFMITTFNGKIDYFETPEGNYVIVIEL